MIQYPKTWLLSILSLGLIMAGSACKKDALKRTIWVKKPDSPMLSETRLPHSPARKSPIRHGFITSNPVILQSNHV